MFHNIKNKDKHSISGQLHQIKLSKHEKEKTPTFIKNLIENIEIRKKMLTEETQRLLRTVLLEIAKTELSCEQMR